MRPDRSLQFKILESLREVYPNTSNFYENQNPEERNEFEDHKDFKPNVYYLINHNLIEECKGDLRAVRITATGIDFLEDDGGISAILKTVTVKFDPDELCKLLLLKLDKLDIPTEKKNSLISTIKKAPADALKTLYTNW